MNNKLYDASAATGQHLPALASGAASQDNNGSQTSSESAKKEAASQNSPGILKDQEFRSELQSLYGTGAAEAIFNKIQVLLILYFFKVKHILVILQIHRVLGFSLKF